MLPLQRLASGCAGRGVRRRHRAGARARRAVRPPHQSRCQRRRLAGQPVGVGAVRTAELVPPEHLLEWLAAAVRAGPTGPADASRVWYTAMGSGPSRMKLRPLPLSLQVHRDGVLPQLPGRRPRQRDRRRGRRRRHAAAAPPADGNSTPTRASARYARRGAHRRANRARGGGGTRAALCVSRSVRSALTAAAISRMPSSSAVFVASLMRRSADTASASRRSFCSSTSALRVDATSAESAVCAAITAIFATSSFCRGRSFTVQNGSEYFYLTQQPQAGPRAAVPGQRLLFASDDFFI